MNSAATIPAVGTGTYHHHDGLGSVIMLTNASGSVVERYRYDVFGYVTILDAAHAPRPATAHNNRFLYTGREWLAQLELYDYRNRSYSTTLGRFLQTDPIGFDAGDVNLYRYVANNPVNLVDPLGLFWWAALDWALTVADAKAAIDTWNDPCASAWDKGLAVGGTVAGAVLPGGAVVAGIRAGRAAAKTPVRWGPATGAGPLGEKVAGTFRGGSYTEMVTSEATTLYRAYGGAAGELGPYWTRTAPTWPCRLVSTAHCFQNEATPPQRYR